MALTAEQRAQARVLRWAAAQIESSTITSHHRKPRGGTAEIYDEGLSKAAEQLKAWARLLHRLPTI